MTLSISDTEKQRGGIARTGFTYLVVSVLCALFGAVYEQFSHGVYSGYMLYAFLFPLAGGALPFFSMALFGRHRFPGRLAVNLYHSGIAALTTGCIFQGVLEIYGTTNALTQVYWFLGVGFVCLGILLYLVKRKITIK